MNKLLMLHTVFKQHVDNIIKDVDTLGYDIIVDSGYRTKEDQARLYSVGRGIPDQDYTIQGVTVKTPPKSWYPEQRIVTKAKPYPPTSAHQWGLAVDFAFIINGKTVYRLKDENLWKVIYPVAQKYDCEDITKTLSWDKGHIQWKRWHVVPQNMNALMPIYEIGDLQKIWEAIDKL